MRSITGMPGIGGSLGVCGLCGEGLIAEILLGKCVQTVEVVGFDKDVCLHDKCLAVLQQNGTDWRTLPDGPLRKAFERASQQPEFAPAVAGTDDEGKAPQFAKNSSVAYQEQPK